MKDSPYGTSSHRSTNECHLLLTIHCPPTPPLALHLLFLFFEVESFFTWSYSWRLKVIVLIFGD
jgi:hypothetical protein